MDIFFYIIGVVIWGLIWGFATLHVNESKGYDGGFWLGFFLGFIGLIIVACKANNSYKNDYASSILLSEVTKESNDRRLLASGGWKCTRCGRVNPSYTGTCGCGGTKYGIQEIKQIEPEVVKKPEVIKESVKNQQEIDNLKLIKEYKDLLDSGIITQEEFNLKKKQLLGL